MNNNQIVTHILVPVVSVITFLLLLVLFFLIKTLFKRYKRDKTIKSLYEQVSIDRLDMYNADVSKVVILARSNDRYERTAESLKEIYDKIENHHQIANKILYELNHPDGNVDSTQSKYKVPNKNFWFKINEIQEEIQAIKDAEESFEAISNEVTHQDKHLNSEFSLFRNNARKAIEVYQNKRLLLDKVSYKIDEIITSLKMDENIFNEKIVSGQMKEAAEILRVYSRHVIKLAEIINEGPQIQMYLDEVIKKAVVALIDSYNVRKADLGGSVKVINFNDSIKAIALQFELAKASYQKLNITETKDLIKKILKSIKALEKIINYEIRARKTTLESFKDVSNEVRNALQRYVEIKSQFRLLVSKMKNIPLELNDTYMQLRLMAKNIDEKALGFTEIIGDKEIAFSSKLERSKILVQSCVEFTQKMNEIMQLLWAINIEASLLRNKFKQAEAAVNEILANIKRQNILITKEEKAHLDDIIKKMQTIVPKLTDENITKDTSEEINLLVLNAVTLYKTLSTNIQIAQMAANTIREFSPQRALNEKLNFALSNSEKLYLEGKYAESLNTLLVEIESGK